MIILRISLLASLYLSIASSAFVRAQDTLWTRTYGGSEKDIGYSVQETSDGGYIIAGSTESFGEDSNDVYLTKTDMNGDTVWTRTYGGSDSYHGYSVRQTTDGGYIVAGWKKPPSSVNEDIYIVKTNASGTPDWIRTYGEAGCERAYSVQRTTDGGYIVAGFTDSFGEGMPNVYLLKANSSGDTLWTRNYEGEGVATGFSVQQTSDGGYIIAGETFATHPRAADAYLLKVNSCGDTLWTRTYGTGSADAGYSVQQTSDGGYIIVGTSYGYYDVSIFLGKTDSSGDTLWFRTYGGSDYYFGRSVQQTSDGGYIVAGGIYYWDADETDVYLLKTDSAGDTLWTDTYGGDNEDSGNFVQQTSDGGYIIAGSTDSFGAGESDVYLVKVSGDVVGVDDPEVENFFPTSKSLSQSYPNPFNSTAVIQYNLPSSANVILRIYDILGRWVETLVQREQPAGYHQVVWDAKNASSGLYFYRIQAGDYVATEKMLLLK